MTSAAQAKLPPELSTSVDDLKSTLHHWTDIDKVKALLKACPRNMPSKGSVIAARVRALEKEASKTARPEPVERAVVKAPPKGAKQITLGDLEVMPPVKRSGKKGAPMPLPEIVDHIRRFDTAISQHTRDYQNVVIYDIVAKGLMLLKGREIHLRQAETQFRKPGVETVSTPSTKQLAKIDEKGTAGFIGWLETTFPEQSTRTARNYMNAARNAGLTSDHSLEDVDALKQAMALHEKNPSDLYKIKDKDETKPTPSDDSPVNLVAEFQRDFFAQLDQSITIRDDMDAPTYEATWQRMKDTLEKFTGARWDMTEGNDAATHGEQHAPKSKGSAKPETRNSKRRRK